METERKEDEFLGILTTRLINRMGYNIGEVKLDADISDLKSEFMDYFQNYGYPIEIPLIEHAKNIYPHTLFYRMSSPIARSPLQSPIKPFHYFHSYYNTKIKPILRNWLDEINMRKKMEISDIIDTELYKYQPLLGKDISRNIAEFMFRKRYYR